ncbi:cyclase family protein [Chloroflexota bacterium]
MNSTGLEYKNIYDISVFFETESICFPGDTPYSREWALTIESTGVCNVSKLVLSPHSGTHIDAPLHFIPNGKSIDDYSIQQFILPAQVVNIEDKQAIRPSELEGVDIKEGDAILFKTDNSESGRVTSGQYSEHFVYLSAEAADFCVSKRVRLVGIDYATVERHGDEAFPAHRQMLGNNILVLEGLNLKGVPLGRYTLYCLPLKIKGGEASPVRAILVS